MIINANEVGYYDLNKAIVACEDSDITVENAMGQRYIGCGTSGKKITVKGTPGNALGAYLNGSSIEVYGNAQDAIGDTMNDGEICVYGSCGDTTGYAMRSGRIFIKENAGYRVGIHMKEYQQYYPKIVIGGHVGDFLGEYQAGGIIVVLGIGSEGSLPVGSFVGTGMHGGYIFIRSTTPPAGLPIQVCCKKAEDGDKEIFKEHVADFCEKFGYDSEKLMSDDYYMLTPNSASPYKQLYTEN